MIAVIDYGMGNLRSVRKALERVGGKAEVTGSAGTVGSAEAVVLPGVGAFSQAMENLESLGMIGPLCQAIRSGKPFLGICLGLQLLFTESEEGKCEGLNIIPGKVEKFKVGGLKVPHMGWNEVRFKDTSKNLLEGLSEDAYFYFAHSYYVEPEKEEVILTTTDYGTEFTSAIRKDNVFGVQFHPEKSGEKGLKLLENFVRIV